MPLHDDIQNRPLKHGLERELTIGGIKCRTTVRVTDVDLALHHGSKSYVRRQEVFLECIGKVGPIRKCFLN